MSQILVLFCSAATAEYRVAGVPAAARAAWAIAAIPADLAPARCVIAAGGDWTPSPDLIAECERLAPGLAVIVAGPGTVGGAEDTLIVRGEAFLAAVARTFDDTRETVLPALFESRAMVTLATPPDARRERALLADLRAAGRLIVAATGKSGDGIVSRYVNRPISQTISRLVLKVRGVRPVHASIGSAAVAVAMALSLFLGGAAGLVLGAILFQSASILDGVDGEIARATHRTSDRGAMIDSLIDAATNLAFITGATVNVALAGDLSGAVAGGAGLLTLATGLLLIGRRAEACGQPVNFDVIKVHFRGRSRPSRVMEWLILLTMRDFFAAAGAALILLGLTHHALLAFATVAAGWLLVTVAVLAATRRTRPSPQTCSTNVLGVRARSAVSTTAPSFRSR